MKYLDGNDPIHQMTIAEALSTLVDQIYQIASLIRGPFRPEEMDDFPGLVFDSAVQFGFVPVPDEPEDYDDPTFVDLGAWSVKKTYRDDFMAIIASAVLDPSEDAGPIRVTNKTPKDFVDDWRTDNGMMSIDKLAEKANMPLITLNRLRGGHNLQFRNIVKLAKTIGCEARDLRWLKKKKLT